MTAVDQTGVSAAAAVTRASGSSFYTAMRILPPPQREAMYEIYAFCRAVDDIADSPEPRTLRRAQLAAWRNDIDRLYTPNPPPKMKGLADTARAFSLAREDFLAVIDGMEMDVDADIQAPDWETLDRYCDRVASAVGRLSVRVFGMERESGIQLAHHLGRALQLTNILRDLDEDAAVARLYLPREALQDAGITATEPAAVLAHRNLGKACEPVVAKAWAYFVEADAIMRRCKRSTVKAPRIMAEVYRAMLEGMVARGWAPPRQRVRIRRSYLLWIMLRFAIL